MTAEKYTNRAGVTRFRPVMTNAEASRIAFNHEGEGFCIGCGEEATEYCDPDTRQALCELCGNKTVFGMEELFVRGFVRLSDEVQA